MTKLEFARGMVYSEGICYGSAVGCDLCPYEIDTRKGGPRCTTIAVRNWAEAVIAEHEKETEVARETVEAERVYKVGDKIKIPHAEELLMNGWKQNGSDLDFDDCTSLVKIEWCGKEVKITSVNANNRIGLNDTWSVFPEHLGLPKIKQPKPEPKVGEYYRDFRGLILKVIADRDTECTKEEQMIRYICLASDGSLRSRSTEELIEKVTGWEG